MTFLELNAEVSNLRRSLQYFVGIDDIMEVTARPPQKACDEASFLRLVTWSYGLLYEAGAVTVPYLIALPPGGSEASRILDYRSMVRSLRTWISHNLGFTVHDVETSRRAMDWMRRACGTDWPNLDEEWEACFAQLCSLVNKIIQHCRRALNFALQSVDDREDILEDLRRRINRRWPASQFDEIISDACDRIGERVDARKFREGRLSKWREYLESLQDDDDIVYLITRRIEWDLIEHFRNTPPIDSGEVMELLDIAPGPDLGKALKLAGSIYESTRYGKKELLLELKKSWFMEDYPEA